MLRFVTAAAIVSLTHASAFAAAPDGVVEGRLASHVLWQDLRPLVPLAGETFTVRFQAARDDLSSARLVTLVSGAIDQSYAATRIGSRGPYDTWEASLPAAPAGARIEYAIELADGASANYIGASGVKIGLEFVVPFVMDFATLEHAPVGATPIASGTVFKVWAPNSTTAHVRGTFNSWTTANPMTKVGEHFIALVPGARAGQEYKYFFNGSVWNTDPRGRQITESSSLNATIVDPLAHAWQVNDFSPAPLDRTVIYQLHVGSFAGRNDPAGPTANPSGYRDVGNRAAHLAELGVNAVMVNPINEFSGSLSGGYNGVTAWGFERALGTTADLKFMIDRLHAHGIAVILDVVWNHMGSSNNFLWNFNGTQIYYDNPAVNTPWGPQLDVDKSAVRDYLADSVDLLLGEYRFDGMRHDAVYELVSAAQSSSGQALTRRMSDQVDRRYADKHVIAEIYNNDPWVTNATPGGLGFDSQYHERFKNAIIDATFASALGDPDMGRLASSIGGSGPGVEGTRVMNYFELHDDAWPLNNTQRAVRDIDTTFPHDDQFAIARTKLANSVVLLSRGVPAILQGTEWLEDDGWETTKIDWSHKQTYPEIFRFYRDMICLRTSVPSLFANSFLSVQDVNEGGNVLVYERSGTDGRSYVVVANFSNSDWGIYRVGLPRAGRWGVIINSDDPIYHGRGVGAFGEFFSEPVAWHGRSQSAVISVPARGLLLLQHEPEFLARPENCLGNANGDSSVDFNDVTAVLTHWNSQYGLFSGPGDTNNDLAVDFTDLTTILINWSSVCSE